MASAFQTIIDEITARLVAAGKISADKVKVGGKYLFAHSAPPRIVWLPISESSGPPVKGGRIPRSLWTRNIAVEVHAWGEDTDAASQLLNDLVVAAHEVLVDTYEFTGAEWPSLNDEHSRHGAVVIVRLTIQIPVAPAAAATTTATIESVEPTVLLVDPKDDSEESATGEDP